MKPRVIIADTNESYISALQLKFAKEFHDDIDLEIITKREYFAALFSKPQKAEILVVSDELYSPDILRHNIDNIFLMQEQYEDGSVEDMRITRLFKYSSIKEIFNNIIGKSAETLTGSKEKKLQTQIILVTSAAGGVGKTTVAMGMAASLAQNYKKVLYINAARLQTFQYRLHNATALSASEVYTILLKQEDFSYSDISHVIRKEAFHYLPAFKASLIALGIDYSVYRKIALSAKTSKEYDFIILDAESTFDEEKLELIDMADKVVVVTDQSVDSVQATNLFLANINGVNSEKYIFICNKFKSELHNALVSTVGMMRFRVNEYIDVLGDKIKCEELAKNAGIRKTAFLVM